MSPIVQLYDPTSTDGDNEVEFYQRLDKVRRAGPKMDILVLGDWNTRVDPDTYQQWAGTGNKFSLDETNDRGIGPQQFAHSHRHHLNQHLKSPTRNRPLGIPKMG